MSLMKTFFIFLLLVTFAILAGMLLVQGRSYETITIDPEGSNLIAYQSLGTPEADKWLLIIHGNRSAGQDHDFYRLLRKGIPRRLSVLAINMQGFGASTPETLNPESTTLIRLVDIEASLDYLHQYFGVGPENVILLGHSLGALQVLYAADHYPFERVIALGPGDFHAFLDDRKAAESYIEKLNSNTGISLGLDQFLMEGGELTPERLFDDCPISDILFIFGEEDLAIGFNHRKDLLEVGCMGVGQWEIVQGADHMYGTENWDLPGPIRAIRSRFLIHRLLETLKPYLLSN